MCIFMDGCKQHSELKALCCKDQQQTCIEWNTLAKVNQVLYIPLPSTKESLSYVIVSILATKMRGNQKQITNFVFIYPNTILWAQLFMSAINTHRAVIMLMLL